MKSWHTWAYQNKMVERKVKKILADYYSEKFWTKDKISRLDDETQKGYSNQLNPYKFINNL